jgi:hypothetical protein
MTRDDDDNIWKNERCIHGIYTNYLHRLSTQALRIQKTTIYNRQQVATHRTQTAEVLDNRTQSSRQYTATSPVLNTATTSSHLIKFHHRTLTRRSQKVTVSSPVLNTATTKPVRNDSSPELDTQTHESARQCVTLSLRPTLTNAQLLGEYLFSRQELTPEAQYSILTLDLADRNPQFTALIKQLRGNACPLSAFCHPLTVCRNFYNY